MSLKATVIPFTISVCENPRDPRNLRLPSAPQRGRCYKHMLDIEQNPRAREYSSGQMIRRVMWKVAQPLFRLSPRPCFGWRRFLLRCFGANIASGVHVYPSSTIYFPRNLWAGDKSAVGSMLLFVISAGPEGWVCADAFVRPGITIGEGAILDARAVAMKDINPRTIVVGNPARESKRREIIQ